MHSAPAIRYPVARSSRTAAAVAGIWVLGAVLCGWWWGQGAAPWQVGWVVACLSASALAAAIQWKSLPQGELQWDGRQWWWHAGAYERPVAVSLHLDLGAAMLLRMTGLPGAARWCCVERRVRPLQWADLRRAVHGAPARQEAQRPAAGSMP